MNKATNKAIIRRPNSALLAFDFGWTFRNWKDVRAVLKQANKLKEQHRLRRVGPARGGYLEMIE